MLLKTRQFGELQIEEEQIISIPRSLLGFEGLHRYVMIDREESKPFRWLQCVDNPDLAFVIVNPEIFFPDYKVTVNAREVADIDVIDPNHVEVYAIVTIPEQIEEMSVNLQGPILINSENNIAKQIVITNSEYSIQHFIMRELQRQAAKQPEQRTPAANPQ